jgi:hypothetical protein
VYTGTPYELTWVDYNDPKGFWIYDTITDTYEFIKNPHNIFEKIDYVDKTASTYNFTDATDKYVKIVVNDKVSQKKFDEFILNIWVAKPHDVKVIEASVIEAVAEAVGTKVDMVSTQSIIESVIDALDTPLDLSILKQKVLAKYQEALAITNSL